MKEIDDKTNESKKEVVQQVSKESSNGGTAQLQDNRSATSVQHKLQDSMTSSDDNGANPIQRKANSTGLPDNLKSGIENLSGYSMDDVKVHYNSSKPAQLQAHAYAQGSDIHLGSGQEKHLAHEAWHVVQQKQGRVKPTKQLKSKVNINDNAGLEKEADVMGTKALQVSSSNTGVALHTSLRDSVIKTNAPAQAKGKEWKKNKKGEDIYSLRPSMRGATWYADGKTGEIWKGSKNKKDKKKWKEHEDTSNLPLPYFMANSVNSYGAYNGSHEKEWQHWHNYIDEVLKKTKEADDEAKVERNKDFDSSGLSTEAQEYIKRFSIIDKSDFNARLWKIAEGMLALSEYVCIVSESGKSGFWLTARVLRIVEILGGNAPKRIIQMPAKQGAVSEHANYDLKLEGEDVVIVDDAAYSGSQLKETVDKVKRDTKKRKSKIYVGLVASSEKAKKLIREVEYLGGDPINIEEDKNTAQLDEEYARLKLETHGNKKKYKSKKVPGIPKMNPMLHFQSLAPNNTNPDTNGNDKEDGNHLTGLYYKVPDYASVRRELLTGYEDKKKQAAIRNYQEGQTEPYKNFKINAEDLNIEIAKQKF